MQHDRGDFTSCHPRRKNMPGLVNDLHRHPAPYYAFHVLSRALRLHEFVRHDGPVSIARGFVPSEWLGFLDRAMLPRKTARLRWFAPFRLCVERLHAAP